MQTFKGKQKRRLGTRKPGLVGPSETGVKVVVEANPMPYHIPQSQSNRDRIETIRRVVLDNHLLVGLEQLQAVLSNPEDQGTLLKAVELAVKMSGLTQPLPKQTESYRDLDDMPLVALEKAAQMGELDTDTALR